MRPEKKSSDFCYLQGNLSTAENTVISPNFLVWKFCGKTQFPHSFGRITRKYAETAFPQNFHTRKFGENTVFYAVSPAALALIL